MVGTTAGIGLGKSVPVGFVVDDVERTGMITFGPLADNVEVDEEPLVVAGDEEEGAESRPSDGDVVDGGAFEALISFSKVAARIFLRAAASAAASSFFLTVVVSFSSSIISSSSSSELSLLVSESSSSSSPTSSFSKRFMVSFSFGFLLSGFVLLVGAVESISESP